TRGCPGPTRSAPGRTPWSGVFPRRRAGGRKDDAPRKWKMPLRSFESGGQGASVLSQQIPGAPNVSFHGPQMTDRDPNSQTAADPRVRNEYVTRPIHRVDQTFVGVVQFGLRQADASRVPSKANDTERYWCEALEVGMRVDPAGEQACQSDVMLQMLAKAPRAERAQDHPELERSESTTELNPRVHQVARAALFRRLEKRRRHGERRADYVHPAAVERTQVERRKEPLMGVDDQRVGTVGARKDVGVRRQHGRHAPVGRIDVQP